MSEGKWPFPADRPVDRARQVAGSYREALQRADPAECAELDRTAIAVGETWIVPQLAQHTDDDRVTVAEAAELTGRSVRWVYDWVAGDRQRRNVGSRRILVRVGAVREAAARGV